MGLLDWVLGRSDPPPAPVTAGGAVYPLETPYVDGTSALGLSAVWRCVTLIADSIADLPLREYRGPEDAPILVPTSRLVRRPLASMSRREWVWRMVATEALHGTAYALHVGGSDTEGMPWSLLPIPPSAIVPKAATDPWGLLPPSTYWIGSQTVSASQLMIVRRHPWPAVPEHVAGVLDLARREFGAYLAADAHFARYWRRGGPVLDVLTSDQDLTATEAETIAQRWVERRARGADYPAVLGKGAKAEPYGADPTTDSAQDARREMVADVGRYFGLPTRLLNAPRVANSGEYANVEMDAVDLWRYTLRGYAGPLEDGISELLPGDPILGRRVGFDPARLLQGDLESRSRSYPPLVAGGILTADEARRIGFGLPALESPAPEPAPETDALPAALAGVSEDASA